MIHKKPPLQTVRLSGGGSFDEMFFDATEIDNKSNKELEIGTKEDGAYREWYKRVINKYMDRK